MNKNNNNQYVIQMALRMIAIFCIIYLFVTATYYVFLSNNTTGTIATKEYTMYEYDTELDFAEFKITDKHVTFNADGSYYYTVRFRCTDIDNYTDTIICNIPAEYEYLLDEEARFKGGLTIAFVKEVVEGKIDIEDLSTLEKQLSNVEDSNIKAIDIQFMWSDFIVEGVRTEDEVKEYFSTIYNGAEITEVIKLRDMNYI